MFLESHYLLPAKYYTIKFAQINLFFGVISFSQQTTHAKGLTLKTILKKNKERLDMSTAVVYNVVDGCRQE
jgi:hypothetical protein